ncbi:MAG TPA: rhomboid family intramembrane serine protease [Flavobacteriales bacterium]|nr:rhomboid family intramembrane serine protease [Flavobacteriales bacterium]
MLSLTLPLILINAVVSISAFSKSEIMARYQFNAYMIYHRKQWYRFITHAFLHADWMHLIVNMFVLYTFGQFVEMNLAYHFGSISPLIYILLYFGAIIVSSISTYRKHKEDHWYNAVGASGAVSAVMFSSVVFGPFMKIYLYGILPLPAIIWAFIYVGYSVYMSNRASDNINHDAHLWGGFYGMFLTLVLSPDIARNFISQITDFIR